MCLPILLLRFKDAMAQQAPWDSTGDILPMASPCLNQPILLQIQGGIILTEASSSKWVFLPLGCQCVLLPCLQCHSLMVL